jgi:CRP-like cAMP-binding protein
VIAGYKSSERLVKAGNDLFRPGEECSALYLLVDGWMFLYDLIDAGRRQILHFALPGALLGLFPGRVAIHGGETLTDATVWQVPHDRLAPLIEEHPAIGLRLAWIVWRERNLAYYHLCNSRRPARERVARSLLELFVRSRMQCPAHAPEEMRLPLMQVHIGDATGLSAVHVNRILHSLRRDEILEFHYRNRRLRILDPDKLVDAARVDPQTILSWTGRFPSA